MTVILWSLPAVIALVGIGVLWCRRRRRQHEDLVMDEDRRRLLRAIAAEDYRERMKRHS